MKRIFVCLIALGLAFSVVGCGGGTTTSDGDGTTTTTVAGTTTTTTTGTTTTTLPDELSEEDMALGIAMMGYGTVMTDQTVISLLMFVTPEVNAEFWWSPTTIPSQFVAIETCEAKMWNSSNVLVTNEADLASFLFGDQGKIWMHLSMTMTSTVSGTATMEYGVSTSDPFIVEYGPPKTAVGTISIAAQLGGESVSGTIDINFSEISAAFPWYPTGTATTDFDFLGVPASMVATYEGTSTATIGPIPPSGKYYSVLLEDPFTVTEIP